MTTAEHFARIKLMIGDDQNIGDLTELPTQAPRAGALAEDLPMVVWLRGDESHCADFALDADEVMEQLGIRRSRLTQISGKELRVGRIRRGRYISPVYRQADVDAYRNWTRATAAHQKSSALLDAAAETLLHQGELLADQVTKVREILVAAVEREIGLVRAAFKSELGDAVQTLNMALNVLRDQQAHQAGQARLDLLALADQLQDGMGRVRMRLGDIDTQLGADAARQDLQNAALQLLSKDLSEVSASLRIQRQDLAILMSMPEQIGTLNTNMEAMAARLDDMPTIVSGRPRPAPSRAARRRLEAGANAKAIVPARPRPKPAGAHAARTAWPRSSR